MHLKYLNMFHETAPTFIHQLEFTIDFLYRFLITTIHSTDYEVNLNRDETCHDLFDSCRQQHSIEGFKYVINTDCYSFFRPVLPSSFACSSLNIFLRCANLSCYVHIFFVRISNARLS